jgi:YD repeat-containing protein
VQQITDRNGNTLVFSRDGTLATLGHKTQATFDENDNKLTETDALGHTTAWTYDADFNKMSETDPLGHKTTWTYDAYRQVTSMTDALGHTTTSTRVHALQSVVGGFVPEADAITRVEAEQVPQAAEVLYLLEQGVDPEFARWYTQRQSMRDDTGSLNLAALLTRAAAVRMRFEGYVGVGQ